MWAVWLAFYYRFGNKLIVPSFSDSVKSLWRYFGSRQFWRAIWNTSLRTFLAFAVSFAAAAVLAALCVLSRAVKLILKPIMVVIRVLPTLAITLVILKLTYGSRTLSPVIVTVLVLFPMIYARLVSATDGIDSGLKDMAQAYKISRRDKIFKIYLPLISPSVLSQTGADLSLGLKVMISAEVLVSTAKGLGGMMQDNNIAGEAANVFALTLASVILGLIVDVAFSQLAHINDRWVGKESKVD